MTCFSYTIQDELGIHARPAGLMVKIARPFSCDIRLEYEGNTVDLKKLFALMGLAVKQGGTVNVVCDGSDEEQAVSALRQFMQENL